VVSKSTAEIVLVGGGIAGASTAFHLASLGQSGVVLLGKGAISSGNTARSSALIRMHYTTAPLIKMAVYSLRVFQRFREIVGDESGFVPCGYVAVVGDGDRNSLEQNVRLQQASGAPVTLAEPDDLQRLDLDVDFFSSRRYAENRPIKGKHVYRRAALRY
jgi:glycine/D-amino acid oxidase-like deaminating enzyme